MWVKFLIIFLTALFSLSALVIVKLLETILFLIILIELKLLFLKVVFNIIPNSIFSSEVKMCSVTFNTQYKSAIK